MIKTLHLISSLRRGGRERQLATIYRYADTDMVSTRIVCFNRSADSYVEEYRMEQDVIFLGSRSFTGRFRELYRIIRQEKPDVIWSWGGFEATFGLLLSLITPAKHINGSVRHGIVRWNRKQIWRMLILHLSRHVVANSKAGLKANRLKRGFVLYNGIDDKFFSSGNHLKLDPERSSAPVLISVANLVPYKDYSTILKALKNIKKKGYSFKYQIVGEGPNREAIRQEISDYSLEHEVSLMGRCSNVRELLTKAGIFIHSSMGEGCSNAIIEAMAAGLPVIASDTGGTSEIVSGEFGRLFPYGNVVELENVLTQLFTEQKSWAVMGQMARHKAFDNFNTQRMTREYHSILNKVINHGQAKEALQ